MDGLAAPGAGHAGDDHELGALLGKCVPVGTVIGHGLSLSARSQASSSIAAACRRRVDAGMRIAPAGDVAEKDAGLRSRADYFGTLAVIGVLCLASSDTVTIFRPRFCSSAQILGSASMLSCLVTWSRMTSPDFTFSVH